MVFQVTAFLKNHMGIEIHADACVALYVDGLSPLKTLIYFIEYKACNIDALMHTVNCHDFNEWDAPNLGGPYTLDRYVVVCCGDINRNDLWKYMTVPLKLEVCTDEEKNKYKKTFTEKQIDCPYE